jgi:aerobic-type carbon monoxide dehydrogenase small subunit (CoxS/CutS family)
MPGARIAERRAMTPLRCTVLADGEALYSCLVLAVGCAEREITQCVE